jgi:hypothetical protein
VGSRAAAKSRERGEIRNGFLPSSPSCRLWATPLPAKHPKRNKQVCFNFVFRSAPLPSPCSDLLHLCKFFVSSSSVSGGRWHDQGLPVEGAAGLLLPLEAVRRLRKERPAG